MGNARWTTSSYDTYATTTSYRSATRAEVFSNRSMPQELDPSKIVIRESCDSVDNPNSTPIILALDVTGSMGEYAEKIAKDGLPELMGRIYEEKPVDDPHIMFMGIDDIHADRGGSLQVSQFEADIKVLEGLRKIWLVSGGGGNNSESYDLAWHFAATKTKIESFDKRGKKGFLFTFGDEEAPYENLSERDLQRVYGTGEFKTLTPSETLALAKEKYNVFHVIIEQGSYAAARLTKVRASWKEIMSNNVLFLKDFRDLSDVVVATMKIANGADLHEVIAESKKPEALTYAFSSSIESGY